MEGKERSKHPHQAVVGGRPIVNPGSPHQNLQAPVAIT
jgi:hypothetical protein